MNDFIALEDFFEIDAGLSTCIDGLAESVAWQLAKDNGLNEPTCETKRLALVYALEHYSERSE